MGKVRSGRKASGTGIPKRNEALSSEKDEKVEKPATKLAANIKHRSTGDPKRNVVATISLNSLGQAVLSTSSGGWPNHEPLSHER